MSFHTFATIVLGCWAAISTLDAFLWKRRCEVAAKMLRQQGGHARYRLISQVLSVLTRRYL